MRKDFIFSEEEKRNEEEDCSHETDETLYYTAMYVWKSGWNCLDHRGKWAKRPKIAKKERFLWNEGGFFTDQNVIPANKLIKTVLRFRLSTLASGLTSKILHFFRPLPETIDIKISHCHHSCTYNSFLEITITIISSIFHNFFTQFSILVSCILLQLL